MRVPTALADALDRLKIAPLALAAHRRGFWPLEGLTVVLYHRVANLNEVGGLDPGMVDATPAEFDAQMADLARNFNPVSVDDVLAVHRGQARLPPASVLVTFDDGYRDNYENAAPLLKKHGMKGLFFVSTGHVSDRTLFWWERINLLVQRSRSSEIRVVYPFVEVLPLSTAAQKSAAVRRLNAIVKTHYGLDLERFLDGLSSAVGVAWDASEGRSLADAALMTWEQVKAMRADGMGIGSHTKNHRVLLTLPPDEVVAELRESRQCLEERLGEPVTTIAYPVGRAVAHVAGIRKALVDAGYELGFTTTPGLNRLAPGEDRLDLKRLAIDRPISPSVFRTLATFPFLAR